MSRLTRIQVLLSLAMMLAVIAVTACSRGAEYPSKDVNFLVPFAPGGATDSVSRKITQEAEPIFKGKFIVVNKPGGSGTLATAEMIQANPDGYTIGLTGIGQLSLQPQVSKLPYGGPSDYTPIISLMELPNALVVPVDSKWKSLEDLMADAKARPNEIRIGSTGKLTAGDMLIQEFARKMNAPVTNVPFTSGAGEATTALLGGHIDGLVTEPGPLLGHVQANKLRILAFMQGGRLASMPDVQSAEEIGFKASYPVATYVIIGPKQLDSKVTDKLYQTFKQAAESEGFKKFADDNAMQVRVMNREELTKQITDFYDRYSVALKESGIETKQ